MKIEYVICNALFALGLFFLNGVLGKLQYGIGEPLFAYGKFTFDGTCEQSFSGNFFQKIVNPTVYLAALSALIQRFFAVELIKSLWLLIPMFWLCRFLYMIWRSVFIFLNLKYEAIAFALSLLLGEGTLFCIILPLVHQEETIWIPATALRDALWYAILIYLLKTVWEIMSKSFSEETLYPNEQRRKIVTSRHNKFKEKYGVYIWETVLHRTEGLLAPEYQEQIVSLIYSIMIYEDYNRPKTMRTAERIAKKTFFRSRKMSLGIMQVQTDQPISDKDSIQLAIERIIMPFLNHEFNPVTCAISQYNPSGEYVMEVNAIYSILTEGISSNWG